MATGSAHQGSLFGMPLGLFCLQECGLQGFVHSRCELYPSSSWFPSDPVRCPVTLGNLDVQAGPPFPSGEAAGLGGPLRVPVHVLGEGWCVQSKSAPFTPVTWFSHIFVVQGGVLHPHPLILASSQRLLIYWGPPVAPSVGGTKVRNSLFSRPSDRLLSYLWCFW